MRQFTTIKTGDTDAHDAGFDIAEDAARHQQLERDRVKERHQAMQDAYNAGEDPLKGAAKMDGVEEEVKIAPLLFNVPAVASRVVGRDHDIMQLWQKLLSGKRVQVLQGLDGLGKTALMAAFCDHAKASGRFSCVYWFDGRRPIADQLHEFVAKVHGRCEKDVLLLFDDVTEPGAVLSLLPHRKEFYVLMTTSNMKPVAHASQFSSQFMASYAVQPLLPTFAEDQVQMWMPDANQETAAAIAARASHIPILTKLMTSFIAATGGSVDQLVEDLDHLCPAGENGLSVSSTINAALDVIFRYLATSSAPGASMAEEAARVTAHLNVGDLNPGLANALFPDGAGNAAFEQLEAMGIVSTLHGEDAFTMHPLIATQLRKRGDDAAARQTAATAVLSLWPRRWRGLGSSTGWSLARHTEALHASHEEQKASPVTADYVAALDRAATFFAHVEGKQFDVAGNMWLSVLKHYDDTNVADAEAARVAREAGRLMYKVVDFRAKDVLHRAYDLAVDVHGPASAEVAQVLVYLAKYLPETQETVDLLNGGAEKLQLLLDGSSGDGSIVLSTEEIAMHEQGLFVLLMSAARIAEQLGQSVSPAAWDRLEKLHAKVGPPLADESAPSTSNASAPLDSKKTKNSFA
jgi:hypothetical protein